MCLVVKNGSLVPQIAKEDIHVLKQLRLSNFGYYCTPYMEVKVSFKNGVCEFKEPRLKAFDYSVEEGYGVIMLEGAWQRIIVETGLHSYEYDKRFAGFSYLFGCYLNAIIPAGSRFFAGTKGDIASDRLIIFETDEAYQKYISSQKRLSRRLMAKARVLIAKLKLKIRQI